mmetsp:Transcript_13171/g.50419  ORF Transcript_13171/g.50419 Transcript_13171/m.50419 type:complete len:209 (+) Transcript_13171:1252-1878(+)
MISSTSDRRRSASLATSAPLVAMASGANTPAAARCKAMAPTTLGQPGPWSQSRAASQTAGCLATPLGAAEEAASTKAFRAGTCSGASDATPCDTESHLTAGGDAAALRQLSNPGPSRFFRRRTAASCSADAGPPRSPSAAVWLTVCLCIRCASRHCCRSCAAGRKIRAATPTANISGVMCSAWQTRRSTSSAGFSSRSLAFDLGPLKC